MNQCLHLGHGLWSQMDWRTRLVVKLVLQPKIKSEIQLCLFIQMAWIISSTRHSKVDIDIPVINIRKAILKVSLLLQLKIKKSTQASLSVVSDSIIKICQEAKHIRQLKINWTPSLQPSIPPSLLLITIQQS